MRRDRQLFTLSRRSLLVSGGVLLAGASFPLDRLFQRRRPGKAGPYGPLEKDPHGVLDLPKGFSYTVLEAKGSLMTDGYQVPGAFDGMACFSGPGGTWVLMRNHELDFIGFPSAYRSGQLPPPEAYDPDAHGGVSRLVVEPRTLERVSSNLVLAGTARNCAGGTSPWGYLSCEETTAEDHGFVFLCSTRAERVQPPRRIDGYGRFRHEAVAVDPNTLIAYLTEDQPDGCLYRFVPYAPERPFEGRLQAMMVVSRPGMDTGQGVRIGTTYRVDWADVAEAAPAADTVRHEARRAGAAIVRRGEGVWLHERDVWFTATSGGPREAGQVFRLRLQGAEDHDTLTLVAQSENTGELDMPDNITVAPWGEVFVAEDCIGSDQFIRLIDAQGDVSSFARNAASRGELAGLCFSPDGGTLFVNFYSEGMTVAVRGPFRRPEA